MGSQGRTLPSPALRSHMNKALFNLVASQIHGSQQSQLAKEGEKRKKGNSER